MAELQGVSHKQGPTSPTGSSGKKQPRVPEDEGAAKPGQEVGDDAQAVRKSPKQPRTGGASSGGTKPDKAAFSSHGFKQGNGKAADASGAAGQAQPSSSGGHGGDEGAAAAAAADGGGDEVMSEGDEPSSLSDMGALQALPSNTVEEGIITFLFKPKVGNQHPQSVDDVQRFHMVLQPTARRGEADRSRRSGGEGGQRKEAEEEEGAVSSGGPKGFPRGEKGGSDGEKGDSQGEKRADTTGAGAAGGVEGTADKGNKGEAAAATAFPARLITVGKKRMPSAKRHERFYGFVSAVAGTVQELTDSLGETHYSTKTRGERVQPGARAAATGWYSLCTKPSSRSSSSNTRLAWAITLPLPGTEGECQQELNLTPQGYVSFSIKNPDIKGTEMGVPAAGPPPQYSKEQRELWGGRRWMGLEEPGLLDVVGAEVLLVGGREELGSLGEAGEHLVHVRDTIVAQLVEGGDGGGAGEPTGTAPADEKDGEARGAAEGGKDTTASEKGGDVEPTSEAGKGDGAGVEEGGAGDGGQVEQEKALLAHQAGPVPDATPAVTGQWA